MYSVANGHCFHCNETISADSQFQAQVLDDTRHFCCPGCLEVARSVVDTGLEDYYKFRSEPAAKADAIPENLRNDIQIYDLPELTEEYISNNNQFAEVQLTVEGLNCPACAWLIEKRLNSHPAVRMVGVDVSARRASVRWEKESLSLSQLLNLFFEIGYRARPFQPDQHESIFQAENKTFLKKLGLAGLLTMQVMMLAFGLYFGVFGNLDQETKLFLHWVSLILSTPVVFYSGSVFIISALNGLSARTLNMDMPVTIAILVTWASSAWATVQEHGEVYFESICMFIFLLLIGRYFEHKGRQKAVITGNNLSRQLPQFARLVSADSQIHEVPAKTIKPGQQIQIKMGDTVPVDCTIVHGTTELDEAILTGESSPVCKNAGDPLFGGTINLSAPVIATVSAALKDSAINQISRAQELAFSQKPRFAIAADKLAGTFVTLVLIIATLTFTYWYQQAPEDALWITVSVLVATCPCALGLATPTAFTAAMSKLNEVGLVIKRTDLLETLNKVTTFAFDKTGTLTKGQPRIKQWQNLSSLPDDQILSIAASIESHSEHPIAKAFLQAPTVECQDVKIFPGEGIQGSVAGKLYRMGNSRFTDSIHQGQADVYLSQISESQQQTTLAQFQLEDELREEVELFFSQPICGKSLLLSGDNQQKVSELAKKLAVEEFQHSVKPEQKLAYLQTLQSKGEIILMVGDGVNDAPVLAGADISVAVNGASDFAQNAADIIMLKDNFSAINTLLSVSLKTQRIIKQNFAWALGYNLLVLPFAVSGLLPPWGAVIGMSLSSLIVTFNSLRINKQKGD